ncbi:hypothetical protein E3N88_43927 [Mikania micrantha]|uniref:Uncharacterized protein n=1 Tax=Mikania micrantha TaxID=192012 RepID=A0A5N6LDJ1_9ASTR|nr:hypothetical protein E3N88_43927 [Mikania micrantha]
MSAICRPHLQTSFAEEVDQTSARRRRRWSRAVEIERPRAVEEETATVEIERGGGDRDRTRGDRTRGDLGDRAAAVEEPSRRWVAAMTAVAWGASAVEGDGLEMGTYRTHCISHWANTNTYSRYEDVGLKEPMSLIRKISKSHSITTTEEEHKG